MKFYFYQLNPQARKFHIYKEVGLIEFSLYFYNLIIVWGEE